MYKKWESVDKRTKKTMKKAIEKRGVLSLLTIINSQYYFPYTHNFKPKEVNNIIDSI